MWDKRDKRDKRGCEVEREERNDVIILYSQKETLNTSWISSTA